jgi:hypothetical protein
VLTNSAHTLTIVGDALVAPGGLFAMAGGSLAGTNRWTVTGTMHWSDGRIAGQSVLSGTLNWSGGYLAPAASPTPAASLTVLSNGVLNLVGSGTKALYGPLTNAGTLNWLGGIVMLFKSGSTYLGTVWNAPGGVFDVQGDSSLGFSDYDNVPAFHNAGLLRKSAGTGRSSFSSFFHNTGTVETKIGTLSFKQYYVQEAGLTLLNGGALNLGQPLDLRGGLLAGFGTLTGSVTNQGVVSPGVSPGQLRITGGYTQGSNGVLQIELAGPAPGTGFDQLAVGGAARLAGTLAVSLTNAFLPTNGAKFDFLVNGSRRGSLPTSSIPPSGWACG